MTPQELIGELYDAVENDDMYSRSYLVYAVEDLCAENDKLRELVRGLEVCADEDADARTDCPLYDEGEPDRCAKERIKRELGIEADA